MSNNKLNLIKTEYDQGCWMLSLIKIKLEMELHIYYTIILLRSIKGK